MSMRHRALRSAALVGASVVIAIAGAPTAFAAAPEVTDVALTIGADASQRNLTWFAQDETTTCVQYSDKADFSKPTTVEAYEVDDASFVGGIAAHATMTGIKPAHTYFYRLGDCGTNWTAAYQFETGDSGEFSFLYYGDPQIYTKNMTAANGWTATLAASTAQFPGADFLMTAGDNVDSYTAANQPAEWDLFLAPQQMSAYAMAPAVGNHDNARNSGLFDEHYGVPNLTTYCETAPGTGDYWFVYNRALFLVLNSNCLDLAQHQAFIQDAKAAAGNVQWIIADFHHAPFSGADHPLDGDVVYLRESFAPILSAEGVNLVLNGHDHDYARSYLMDGSSVVPGSDGPVVRAEAGQVLYVATNSASGGKYYDLTGPYPWTALANQEYVPNYSLVDINGGNITITTYQSTDNAIVDQVTLRR